MNIRYLKIAAAIIVMAALSTLAIAETVEQIAAVVGDQIILASEVANQVQLYFFSTGKKPEQDTDKIARDVLDQMINDALILSAAKDDTTITVTDDEVRQRLDEHMASLVARFPSEEAFLEQLRVEGLTKRSLEKRYRPEIRDQILKQKIISQKLSKVSVSRQEVEDFFKTHADSLPEIPSRIRLAHILVKFKVSPATDDSVRQLAEQARQEVLKGKSLIDVVNEFTPKAPGVVGGRIGFIRRNEVVEEFGRAAFNLQPGGLSGIVRTEYGWHIIQCYSRLRDSVDVGQILFLVAPSVADSNRATATADSLYKELLKGADFKELAKADSDDDSSRAVGGELDLMTSESIRPEFAEPLQKIDTGQITAPILSQAGYHILKLLERQPGRPLDITKDFDIIRNFAKQEKTERMVNDWVNELKKKTYIDIRT